MNEKLLDFMRVVISEDSMEARLYLSSTPDDYGKTYVTEFTYDNILEVLNYHGVKAGIDKSLVKAIAIDRLYDRYHIIAKGTPAENGVNGSFVYHFKTKLDNKPKLLEDGSVDYHGIENYEPVSQGALIAEYIPATTGHFGFTIKGGILNSVPGKDLSPLTGTGFTMSEDKTKYYSDFNGKIELKGTEIIVSNILDIHGDVDLTTGDIVFNGDVIVHGNVLVGSLIKVTGTLTILGNVEGAYISSGGEMQLKSGMQGGGKGVIECNSDVWGKFFEHTIIRTKCDLHANSMLNCDTFSEGNIYISGRHGIIAGGQTACQGSIYSTVVGNMAQVRTNLAVGVNERVLAELHELESRIKEIDEKLRKHNQILEKLNQIKNPTEQEKLDKMFEQVNTSMKELNLQHDVTTKELQQKLFILSSCSKSVIQVNKYMYPNVNITLNGLHYKSEDTFVNVTVKEHSGEIVVINNV